MITINEPEGFDRTEAFKHLNIVLQQNQAGFIELDALHRRLDEPDRMDSRGAYFLPADASANKLEEAVAWCERHMRDGTEIMLAYNPRREQARTKDAVSFVTAVFADLDLKGADNTDALEALRNAPVPPHLIINSGYGLHAVWFIQATTNTRHWSSVMRAVARHFRAHKADEGFATDTRKTLRLVPFPNLKKRERPRLTEILEYNQPSGALNLDVLGDAYDARQVDEIAERERILERNAVEGAMIPEGRRNRALFEIACAMRRNAAFSESAIFAALLEVNQTRCEKPLAEEAVRLIVKSAMKYKPADNAPGMAFLDVTTDDDVDVSELVQPLGTFLTKEFEDSEPLLYGLHRREIGMLVSLPNIGKTTLGLNFSMSAAAGLPFPPFTVRDTPLRIMYLDFENRASMLQRDVATMLQFFGEDYREMVRENLFITADFRFGNVPLSLTDSTHLHRVAKQALEKKVDLVIVDTLSAAVSLINENDNAEVKRRVIEPFQAFANYANTAVLLVHHIGKGNESDAAAVYQYRGASVLGSYARLVLQLKPDQHEDDAIVLKCAKIKGMPFQDHILKLDRASRWFQHTDLVVPTTKSLYTHIVNAVTESMRRAEIAVKLSDEKISVSDATLKRRLKEAVERGDIEMIANGVYAPRRQPEADIPFETPDGPLTDLANAGEGDQRWQAAVETAHDQVETTEDEIEDAERRAIQEESEGGMTVEMVESISFLDEVMEEASGGGLSEVTEQDVDELVTDLESVPGMTDLKLKEVVTDTLSEAGVKITPGQDDWQVIPDGNTNGNGHKKATRRKGKDKDGASTRKTEKGKAASKTSTRITAEAGKD